MVSLGSLPALHLNTDLISSSPGMQAFRVGEQDQIAQNQRNLLQQVGGQAASGNYLEAARTAMQGGNLNAGLNLIKTQQAFDAADTQKRLKLLDFFGRGAAAADSPEKWQVLLDMAQNVYGQDVNLTPYRDFTARPQVMQFLANTKEQLERDKLKAQTQLAQSGADLKRTELAGEQEERDMRRQMLSQLGLVPEGGPAPSYQPSPTAAPQAAMQPPMAPTEATPAPDPLADLSQAERATLGLMLTKGDYSGAAKLLQGEKPTALMKNLEAAGLQPGTPEYTEAMLQASKQGVTIEAGEKKFSQTRGENIADKMDKIEERTDAARDIAFRYNQIATLLSDPNVYTGKLAQPIDWLKGFGTTFLGLDLQGVAAANVAEKVRASTVGKIREMAGDTRMSDPDRKFYLETIPGLGDDPESIALAAHVAVELANANMAKEAKLDQFFGQFEKPVEAWRAYRAWERKQKIFSPELIAAAKAKAKKKAVRRGPLAGIKQLRIRNPATGEEMVLDEKTNTWVKD